MRGDLKRAFERQAAWQRSRSRKSWAEKLRTAVITREALLAIRASTTAPHGAGEKVREAGDGPAGEP